MIYTVIADITRLNLDKALKLQTGENNPEEGKELFTKKEKLSCPPPLGSEIISHINGVSNRELKKERAASYILLTSLMIRLFGNMPLVDFESSGKPRFRDGRIYFNISHAEKMVAVTVSDSCPVGVDIEGEIEKERAARLEKRFFSELSFSDRPLEVEYSFCIMGELGECEYFEVNSKDFLEKRGLSLDKFEFKSVFHSDSFTARWTLYESSLKCDGGGFTSLPCLGMLLLECCSDIKKLVYEGCVYYISTTTSK